jgi:hypothetical protein
VTSGQAGQENVKTFSMCKKQKVCVLAVVVDVHPYHFTILVVTLFKIWARFWEAAAYPMLRKCGTGKLRSGREKLAAIMVNNYT